MKNIIRVLSIITIFIFAGCKKDETTTPVTQGNNGKVSFHIHNVMNSNLINYTTTYTDNTGRKLNLSMFQYYISGIRLIKNDNTELPVTGKYILVKPTANDYEISEVPEGSYKGIRFNVGIDSVTNHADITKYTTGNPLAIQTPTMHWSWNTGYLFIKMEGMVDTTISKTGTPDAPITFHIGTDKLLKAMDFSSKGFTVSKGATKELELTVNLNKLFDGIDLRTERTTHTMNNLPLATKIFNNLSASFSMD